MKEGLDGFYSIINQGIPFFLWLNQGFLIGLIWREPKGRAKKAWKAKIKEG